MPRPLLEEARIHPNIQNRIGGDYPDTVAEVQQAVATHAVTVVGMAQNPFCKKARKQLDSAGIDYHYLEYGSYFKEWHLRLSLKMWSGWPTFPMVFVNGQLIGGNEELGQLLNSGELKQALANT